MKIHIVFPVLLMITGCALAQKVKENQVPAPVVAAFHELMPDIKNHYCPTKII